MASCMYKYVLLGGTVWPLVCISTCMYYWDVLYGLLYVYVLFGGTVWPLVCIGMCYWEVLYGLLYVYVLLGDTVWPLVCICAIGRYCIASCM